WGELRAALAAKIRAAAASRVSRARAPKPPQPAAPPRPSNSGNFNPLALIAIGASTGGTEAIEDVLTHLPPGMPGIVITQHIPAGFSRAFAERLNKFCPMRV